MLDGGGEFFVAGAFSLLNGRFLDGCLRPFFGYFLRLGYPFFLGPN